MPKKLRVRRSSSLMTDDPYTLFVALNSEVKMIFLLLFLRPLSCYFSVQNEAKGTLYIDDGHSFDYKNGAYLLRNFTYSDNRLISR